MVGVNETYAESAARELAEELGVSGVPLTAHERFYFEAPQNHLWCAVFSAVWDGPLQVQPEEVQQACFMPVAAGLRLSRCNPDYCPDSLDALKRYLAQG
jgi:8-oxo-dGTP pyrophosphatase MutT (NUDIX family)